MKLLTLSSRVNLLYAAILISLAVPALYFGVQQIVREEVNESLVAKKENVIRLLEKRVTAEPNGSLLSFDPDILIMGTSRQLSRDSFYQVSSFDSVSQEHIPYRVLVTTVTISGRLYEISLRNSLLDSDELIESFSLIVGGILVLVITGSIIINRLTARRVWKPFYELLDRLQNFRLSGSSSIELPQTRIEEFTKLNKTLAVLIDSNRQVYQAQKEFTENASHEMQTPLAIISGNLELLMETEPLSEEQAGLLDSLQQTTDRMSRLNKALLLLSRLDNASFGETRPLKLEALIGRTIEQYSDAISEKEISLDITVTDNREINGNSTLLEILLGNLVGNAIRHNHRGGIIFISFSAGVLEIANSGGNESLDRSLLFRRFQKQGVSGESPGLGLAIVKKICELCQYRVTYIYSAGMHRFNIGFNAVG